MERRLVALFFLSVMMQSLVLAGNSHIEADVVGKVVRVKDGYTFRISSGEWIRLADIDAPEENETGYAEAKAALFLLALGRTAYLDVDDTDGSFRTDDNGRLVCVAYFEHNSTHYLNVNMELVERGVVELRDYPNEFDADTWTLYVEKESAQKSDDSALPPEIIIAVVLSTLIFVALLAVVVLRRKRTR